MTRHAFVCAFLFSVGVPFAEAQTKSFELEFVVDEAGVGELVEHVGPLHGTEHAARLLGLGDWGWALNRQRFSLEGMFEIRTLFARREALWVDRARVEAAFKRLADAHRVEVTTSATVRVPQTVTAQTFTSPCTCKHTKTGVHQHLALGELGEPAGSVTETRPYTTAVRMELWPVRALDRTNSVEPVGGGATVYEIAWRGRFTVAESLEARVELFRRMGHKALVAVELNEAFETAITEMVCSSFELLDDAGRLERLGAPESLQAGFTQALVPQPTSTQGEKLRKARVKVRSGNLAQANAIVSRMLQTEEVETLQAEIEVKQRTLDVILAASRELRAQGETGVARRLVESYRHAPNDRTWWYSSELKLEHARALLAIGEADLAREALRSARRHDPSLKADPEFVGLWTKTEQ